VSDSQYLTDAEVLAAQSLHKRTPYAIVGVSHGFFSIARHYGGCNLDGCHYTYIPECDECIRDDVLKLVTKMRKRRKVQKEPQQGGLW
jgi:hypothetical protein